MISDHRCFFCFSRVYERLLEKSNLSPVDKRSFVNEMISLYQAHQDDFIAPLYSRELQALLKKYTGNGDPYYEEKKEYNRKASEMVPRLEEIISGSSDPFFTALRIAIAGNIIDFATGSSFDLMGSMERILNEDFAKDDSVILKKALKSAENVLYLGDNAGEIIFDRLFIRTINHPGLTYVVRGSAAINDVTMEDAEYARMGEVANVISSGFDAPSTIPSRSGEEFRRYYEKADVIISKGQGNLEGLITSADKRIFFLLLVKCDVISDFLGVKKNDIVVLNASAGF